MKPYFTDILVPSQTDGKGKEVICSTPHTLFLSPSFFSSPCSFRKSLIEFEMSFQKFVLTVQAKEGKIHFYPRKRGEKIGIQGKGRKKKGRNNGRANKENSEDEERPSFFSAEEKTFFFSTQKVKVGRG